MKIEMLDEKISSFSDLCRRSAENKTLKNIVFTNPVSGDTTKIKGVSFREKVQFEFSMTEGRVKQVNVAVPEINDFVSEMLLTFSRGELNDTGGNASLMISKKGRISLVRHGNIGAGIKNEIPEKEKNYILDGSEKFLYFLGISDKNGRVHDKKQAKFRQINRFLEHLSDYEKYLPKSGNIRIADLCCGKSYLSFAVYHYFCNIRNRSVVMDCIDLKKSVMDFCSEIAKESGFLGMRFEAGDVTKYQPDSKPHLVISLHACDTATDIVLERAVALNADVILATPCCHRELSRVIDCEPLRFISKNSILKSKFCDAATDALRVLRLESLGYKADAVEMIDAEETPKNVLIRAHRNNSIEYKGNNRKAEEYRAAYRFLCGSEPKEFFNE